MIQVKFLFCSQGTQGSLRCHCFHCCFSWQRVDAGRARWPGLWAWWVPLQFDMALFKWGTLPMEKDFFLVFTRADDVIFWNYNYSYTIFSYCIISLFLSEFPIVQCFREGAGSRGITLWLGVWIIMRLKFRSWVVVWNPLLHFQVERVSLWNHSES